METDILVVPETPVIIREHRDFILKAEDIPVVLETLVITREHRDFRPK
jgi:hypothetical protein